MTRRAKEVKGVGGLQEWAQDGKNLPMFGLTRRKVSKIIKLLPALLSAVVFLALYGYVADVISELVSTLFPVIPKVVLQIFAAILAVIDLLNSKFRLYEPVWEKIFRFLTDEVPASAHAVFVLFAAGFYACYKLKIFAMIWERLFPERPHDPREEKIMAR